jgi:hypothetical protein
MNAKIILDASSAVPLLSSAVIRSHELAVPDGTTA